MKARYGGTIEWPGVGDDAEARCRRNRIFYPLTVKHGKRLTYCAVPLVEILARKIRKFYRSFETMLVKDLV